MENDFQKLLREEEARGGNSPVIIALMAAGFGGVVIGIWIGALLFAN
jgi:hypothetical protein